MKGVGVSLAMVSLVVTSSAIAFAVGTGGGGAVPTCNADTWTCGAWGACTASGRQSRTCTLSFDCASAATPKPAEEQSCTPPAAPAPTTPAPTTPPGSSACREDVWQCGAWSASCDVNGNHIRACTLVKNCGIGTPAPQAVKPCERLQCGEKPTIRERVACRLDLSPAAAARELELQYLPEECRALKGEAIQEACEERYKGFKPCWDIPAGEARFACARNALSIGRDGIAAAAQACKGRTGAARAECAKGVREQAYAMIKFRFYDLAQRAEALIARGADKAAVADFVTVTELEKQRFNEAGTFAERQAAILRVRDAWRAFVERIKETVR